MSARGVRTRPVPPTHYAAWRGFGFWPNNEVVKSTGSATASCRATYVAAATVFKALGHPTRLMVVATLGEGERCVCDLTELAGCDMSTMSNHLAILKAAGVVSAERRASKVFYRIARPCVLDVIGCLGEQASGACATATRPARVRRN